MKRPDFDELGRAAAALLALPEGAGGKPAPEAMTEAMTKVKGDLMAALVEEARRATPFVPHRRRQDWGRLVEGFRKREVPEKRRARIEGLLRACRLFSTESTKSTKQTERKPTRGRVAGPVALGDRVDVLPGLGPTAAEVLAEHGVRDVGDLLLTVPRSCVDLRAPLSGQAIFDALREASERRQPLAVRGVVDKASMIFVRGRRGVRASMKSDGVAIDLWWFFFSRAAMALRGELVAVGIPSIDPKRPRVLRMAHPRTVTLARCGGVEPIYAFPGVQSSRVGQAVREALDRTNVGALDPLPATRRRSAIPLEHILRDTHTPKTPDDHLRGRIALRERMAFAEACWLVGRRMDRERALGGTRAHRLRPDEKTEQALLAALGFSPTAAQLRAIATISRNLDTASPSRTLLTGDVGTGKTAVLLAAAAQAVSGGRQVAILAPTTLLADQYLGAAQPLADATGARIALLPSAAGKERSTHARVAEALRKGDLDVVVGTHALLSGSIAFARLGLVIVDEQHRLGVAQRLSLVEKGRGESPHLLSVSATPIPRTLALALRGEISTAHLDERPAGRSTPETAVLPRSASDQALSELRACIDRGERAFVVCGTIDPLEPLAGEGEDEGAPGAKERAEQLQQALGPVVALVHGSLDEGARRRAIGAFRRGEASVLVGTSMLEVGIDVPEATLVIIDGAERFGLAQLHQLRGRVGRGARPGRCLLVHGEPIGDRARQRLLSLCEAQDGLAVARADLKLRGPGDLEGARQSGESSGMRFLDPLSDEAIVTAAAELMRAVGAGELSLESDELSGLCRALGRFDAHAASMGLARGEAG